MKEFLEKYASLATQFLEENKKPFTNDDIVKVASFLIETDIVIEKVAEAEDTGRILADSFWNHFTKLAAPTEGLLEAIRGAIRGVGEKIRGPLTKTIPATFASVGDEAGNLVKLKDSTVEAIKGNKTRRAIGQFIQDKPLTSAGIGLAGAGALTYGGAKLVGGGNS